MSTATRSPRRPAVPVAHRLRGALGLLVAGETTPAFLILACACAILLVLGLVMTFSASFVESTVQTGDPFGIFAKQLQAGLLGLLPAAVLATTDYRRWRRLAVPLLLVALGASALVLVPGIGVRVHGAQRWFAGPVSFQPSELLKLAVPYALASIVARRWARVRSGDLRALLMPGLPILALAALLVMAGPDLETAALIVAIGATVLYVAGLPWQLLGGGVAAALLAGAGAIATSGFRRARIAAWLDPTADPGNFGYQTLQGRIALGSGGLLGVGLGQARGKWGYVPNAHTDFIFAIIGEELGLVGALVVLALFLAVAVGGVQAAVLAPDPFGRLLAASLTCWLLLQAVINIGPVVGLLPVTGVTLPLVSAGGSSLLVTLLGVGLLLSVARAGRPGARG